MAEKKDAKPTWISTQTEISKAIQGWSDVTQDIIIESKVSPKIAPDEQMLSDIEALIQKIKAKLDEFSAPVVIKEDISTKELPISIIANSSSENP